MKKFEFEGMVFDFFKTGVTWRIECNKRNYANGKTQKEAISNFHSRTKKVGLEVLKKAYDKAVSTPPSRCIYEEARMREIKTDEVKNE